LLCIAFSVKSAVVVDIDIKQPEHHLAQVKVTFPKTKLAQLQIKMPTWRTGNYQILPLANGVRLFSATDERGKVLPWHKTDKNTWQVEQTRNKKVVVSYQVYANELGKRTRHIDDSHAYLDASAVVMYHQNVRKQQYIVNLQVPKLWKSASGLISGKKENQFIATNYDVLIDSPIETGIQEVHNFTVDNVDYTLVIWGKGNYDSAQMVKDLSLLVKQGKYIWPAEYPFSRYVFMVHATSGERGATEHLNSTVIQRSRYKFNDRKDYLGFLQTAAHEFVHTWNVKQYRPEGLVPYDYQRENYTSLLWVSEGSTSYFQAQLLLNAGLMTTEEYFTDIAKRINGYMHKPGLNFQSVAESSFEHWLEQGGDYDNNFSANIYNEGFLVSWLLDFNLLAKSNGTTSYKDVHNALYQQYRLPHAFSEQDMLTILKAKTGENYKNWWQQNVHGHVKPDFAQLLSQVGLELYYGEKNEQKAWSGITTTFTKQGIKVTRVEKDSPAWLAGIAVDDIIIALDDLRINETDLTKRLLNFKPEQAVKITYFRRDQLVSSTLNLKAVPKDKLKVRPMKNATEQQKSMFKAWLGVDFPVKK
jgi:predicted metalloprotease with PDZ domain